MQINLMQRDTTMTKGQVEAAITAAISQFERDYLGRGPKEARTFIMQDLVLVRLKGILSIGEQQVATQPGGIELIKQMRSRLVESFDKELAQLVEQYTALKVISMHTDISTRTGERIFLFDLEDDLEERFRQES